MLDARNIFRKVSRRDLRLLPGATKEYRSDHLALSGTAERFLKLVEIVS